MGIPGLLPVIKSVMKPIHIKDLAGTSVAVDSYSWLHKAAFSCSRELCRGIPTRRHIDYCIHRVNLLRHNGVKPVLVFDGDILPMKSDQEAKRARSRKENLERAIEHELCGNQNAATEYYQKAVDISPLIAYQLIEVLRKEGVDYIVAPYEADAQMAYLSITNHVSAVITEDSDLIPFGCKRIIFKMDRNGNGEDFQYNELTNNIGLDFSNFTKEMLLEMCILSGCDYLQSLQGVGIKKAYELVRRFRCYKKIIKHLKYNGVSVPASYEATFGQAILTFRHQLVYDPMVEDVVHLRELPTNLECDLDGFGRSMPKNLAKAIAMGDIDPISKKSFHEEVFPCMAAPNDIPEKNILHREKRRRVIELPVQKNVLTNYFFSTSSEAKRQFKAPRIGPDIETESRLLVKNDEENLLHGNIISISEHTAGVSYAARLPECKSFSHSCLTTDVEEKLEVHDCMVEKDLNTMAHECEDLRCTSDFQRFGPSSAMNMKIRCNIESDEEKAIKSRTFNQENAATDGVESVSDFIDTSDMSHDICSSNKPLFGSQLTLHDENDAIQANDGKAHRTNGALSTHKRPGAQQTIDSMGCFSKDLATYADSKVANYFYRCCIPFNVARSPHFKAMIEVVSAVKAKYEPPSYDKLRGKFLDEKIEISEPLVRVLRLVDSDQMSMGYIYEAMERAKESIKRYYENNEDKFQPIWDIIDQRWNRTLHKPIHGVAHLLNPSFFNEPNFNPDDVEIRMNFQEVVVKMYRSSHERVDINNEMQQYISQTLHQDALEAAKRLRPGKHIPSFTSDLIGKKMEEDRFACNLSHLEHYSRIAEESMDRLTSTMSFRSNTAGARASGLRAPKLASVQRGCRNQSQTALLDTDLSKFAYKSNATKSLNHQSRGSLSHANSSKFAYNLDIKKSNQKSQLPLLDADFNKFAYHPGILKKGIKDLKQI